MAALSLLAQSADQNCGNREAVAQACAIDPLVALVLVGSAAAQVSAASALGYLASGEFDDFAPASQEAIIQAGGIEALVWLMRTSRLADEACDPATWALAHLAANNDNRKAIVEAGAIEPLVALVRGGSAVAQENAAAALLYLAESPDNEAISTRCAASL